MKSIYDLGSTSDRHEFLFFFLKFLLVLVVLFFLGAIYFLYVFFKSWDDANKICGKNSTESWTYFLENVRSNTSNIKNVKAEDHSNFRQRQYRITFETDSSTLFDIIAKKQLLKDSAHPNLFHIDYSRTYQSISFNKKAGENVFDVKYYLVDHTLTHVNTCDSLHERCIEAISNTFDQFSESFLTAYKNELNSCNFAPNQYDNRISTISFTIYPSGKVNHAAITDKWNKFDYEFKRTYLKEFNQINFGKKDRADSLDCQFPIVFPSLESWGSPAHR